MGTLAVGPGLICIALTDILEPISLRRYFAQLRYSVEDLDPASM